MKKISTFKYVIKEFHEGTFPEVTPRDLCIPEINKTISLVGSRRAGKTFYFYQVINDLLSEGLAKDRILYVNFEDDRLFPLKVEELSELLEAYYELYPENKDLQKYFFFDEIQNITNWEIFVRRIVDRENAKVYLTGSSSKLLSREIATSLRGRTLTFYLFPLSFKEFLRFKNVHPGKDFAYSSSRFKIKKLFKEYLDFGGFPEVVSSGTLKQAILSNYFEMLIYKDLIERFSIRNTMVLRSLTKFLITNISSAFSINSYYNSLKQELKLSKVTIMEYLSYLTDINLIYLVPIFSYSLKVQQVNPSKVYCVDTGLRNAVAFRFSEDEGRLAENVVFIELKRRGYEVYYWKNTREVDFIVKDEKGDLTAINVSYTDSINKRELEGLHEFKNQFYPAVKELIILTRDERDERNGINLIPIWQWLLKEPEQ